MRTVLVVGCWRPVSTSAATYTVPSNVNTVTLTGTSAQTVTGNRALSLYRAPNLRYEARAVYTNLAVGDGGTPGPQRRGGFQDVLQ